MPKDLGASFLGSPPREKKRQILVFLALFPLKPEKERRRKKGEEKKRGGGKKEDKKEEKNRGMLSDQSTHPFVSLSSRRPFPTFVPPPDQLLASIPPHRLVAIRAPRALPEVSGKTWRPHPPLASRGCLNLVVSIAGLEVKGVFPLALYKSQGSSKGCLH